MKLSRRTNTIILWIISIALLVGMVITFTPSLGNLGSGGGSDASPTALLVNEQPISELQVARAQQSPLYRSVRDGEVGADLELLLLDSLIDQEVLRQAAARINVSGGEVRQAVDDFRRSNGVAGRSNDERYLSVIGGAGYDDASFRDALREQIRVERFQDELTDDVTVTEAEVEAYYQVNRDDYRTEPRIEARMITLDDTELAAEVLDRLDGGADFAEVAAEVSVERAERGGALGAAEGETDPRPVGRAALPTAVAGAAFALQGEGRTDVVEANGRAYIVQVETYLPAEVQPLEEVRTEVEADALAAKQQEVLEDEIERLRGEADVSTPDASSYSFDDSVVARVGEAEILASDLARATYSNPQIQQALSPQTADLIAGFFKPSTLAQLIDIELAYQGAQQLDASFIGTKAQIAQQAFDVVTRDAAASDEEVATYYEANLERFTVAASADATRVEFGTVEEATAFRTALLDGEALTDAAETLGGSVEELGTVAPGQLDDELDTALFQTDAFAALPDSELAVSDVLVIERPLPVDPAAEGSDATGDEPTATDPEATEPAADDPATEEPAADDPATEEPTAEEPASDDPATEEPAAEEPAADVPEATEPGGAAVAQSEPGGVAGDAASEEVYLVLVADRTPETVRSLTEVRAEVEAAVLSEERAQLREAWLTELQEEIAVENLLNAAAAPQETTPEDTTSEESTSEEPSGEESSGEPAGSEEPAADGGADATGDGEGADTP